MLTAPSPGTEAQNLQEVAKQSERKVREELGGQSKVGKTAERSKEAPELEAEVAVVGREARSTAVTPQTLCGRRPMRGRMRLFGR